MEDNSPYQASRAAPAMPPSRVDWRDEAPHEITSPIRHMWILLALGGAMTALGAIGLLATDARANTFLLVVMGVSTAFYLLSAFGVYRRSRVAACVVVTMCALGALGTLVNISAGQGSFSGVAFTAILAVVSIRGTLATFRYHRHLRQVRSRPPRTRLSDDPAFAPKVDTAL